MLLLLIARSSLATQLFEPQLPAPGLLQAFVHSIIEELVFLG